jgi:hypothetical protein
VWSTNTIKGSRVRFISVTLASKYPNCHDSLYYLGIVGIREYAELGHARSHLSHLDREVSEGNTNTNTNTNCYITAVSCHSCPLPSRTLVVNKVDDPNI